MKNVTLANIQTRHSLLHIITAEDLSVEMYAISTGTSTKNSNGIQTHQDIIQRIKFTLNRTEIPLLK